ncbi:hypothetical protein [Paraburkholderia sp. J63]|uniref:hypothetical protein n=1 Tax=Paraburkholderia sp. J63 TaxID=2805434 RepID=UPI002ABDCF78|nr:hypothetical protein [Paraburkholderia sp. J63]
MKINDKHIEVISRTRRTSKLLANLVRYQLKVLDEIRLGQPGGFFAVRPAWAPSCGCKSRHKLVTANEVKRNCMRATECGEEAWSVNREPMDKNCIEGAAGQGEPDARASGGGAR